MATKRVRILHILQAMCIGGMEKRVLRLASGLDSSIYEIHAVSLRPTEGPAIDWPKERHHFFPIEPGLHFSRLNEFAKFIRDGRFDIVHSHNWSTMFYGLLAARLAKVPIILHGEHGPNHDDWQGVSRKRELVTTMLAHLTTKVVAVNQTIKLDVRKRWKLPETRVVSIPNGVDLSRFMPSPNSVRNENELVIGTVARFDRIKNMPCMIKGFDLFRKQNPTQKVRLVLVGDGPLMNEMRNLAASMEYSSEIEFPGATSTPEMQYSRFDLYLNASFSEGMSNTILESMACGLPIIASDIPGNHSWLEENVNALFFQSNNPEALSNCLGTMATNADLRIKMGSNNRQLTEQSYDNGNFIKQYDQLYMNLLRREK